MKKIYEVAFRYGYNLSDAENFGVRDYGFCFNQGLISIDEETKEVEGVLTFDYLKGNFNEKSISFEIFALDIEDKQVVRVKFRSINYFEGDFPQVKKKYFFVEDDDSVELKTECSIKIYKQLKEIEMSSLEEKLVQARKRFA